MRSELHTLTAGITALVGGGAGLDDQELTDAVRAAARLRAASEALWLSLAGEVNRRRLGERHGARSTATWLAGLGGQRPGTAKRDVELADALAATPSAARALAAGEVSKDQAVELARAGALPVEEQERLTGQAAGSTVGQVASAVRRARLAHGDTDPPVESTCTITRSASRVRLEADLDLVEGELVEVALDAMAEALKLPPTMGYPQRRAAALVGLARHYLDHAHDVPAGRLGRPHVLVIVDLEVVEGREGGSATLSSGAVISGEDARRLCEDAGVSRVVTRGRSEVLDVGRASRNPTPAQAKAVIVRDRHCRFEDCDAPPWACEVHHVIPWEPDGETNLDNLGLLCWHHHKHVHRHGPQRLVERPDGRWTLTPPVTTTQAA